MYSAMTYKNKLNQKRSDQEKKKLLQVILMQGIGYTSAREPKKPNL